MSSTSALNLSVITESIISKIEGDQQCAEMCLKKTFERFLLKRIRLDWTKFKEILNNLWNFTFNTKLRIKFLYVLQAMPSFQHSPVAENMRKTNHRNDQDTNDGECFQLHDSIFGDGKLNFQHMCSKRICKKLHWF